MLNVNCKLRLNCRCCCGQVPAYLHAGARQFGFMLRGLRELEANLHALSIPFYMLKGDPVDTIPQLVKDLKAGLLVADFGPLRLGRQWRDKVCWRPMCRPLLIMDVVCCKGWGVCPGHDTEPFAGVSRLSGGDMFELSWEILGIIQSMSLTFAGPPNHQYGVSGGDPLGSLFHASCTGAKGHEVA